MAVRITQVIADERQRTALFSKRIDLAQTFGRLNKTVILYHPVSIGEEHPAIEGKTVEINALFIRREKAFQNVFQKSNNQFLIRKIKQWSIIIPITIIYQRFSELTKKAKAAYSRKIFSR